MSVKLLTEHHLGFLSLKGGYTGLSESTLVKIQHCWISHVTAHLLMYAKNLPAPQQLLDIQYKIKIIQMQAKHLDIS